MKFVHLTDICDFQGGTQPPKNEWCNHPTDQNVRMLQIRDFTQSKKDNIEYVQFVKTLKLCQEDDILIGRYGASIGKILTGLAGAYNVAIIKTIPNDEFLTKQFLFHLLKGPKFQSFINTIGARAAQAGFNKTDLSKFKVPVIPRDDQIRIATLLSQVETLIAARKDNLRLLDEFLKSTFLEMFGDPVRNEKGWELTPMPKIGKFVSGGTPSKEREDYWCGNFPWVSPKDMKRSYIEDSQDHISEIAFKETSLKIVQPGNLLIVVRGMILAHSFPLAINSVPVAINQDMKAIQPSQNINVCYLMACLDGMKRQILVLISSAGHGTKKFDSLAMNKVMVPVPPLPMQEKFAAIVEKTESLKARYQQNLTELENLYAALSQKAFKGELDLSRVPPAESGTNPLV